MVPIGHETRVGLPARFGKGWSHGAQIFWRSGGVGAVLDLVVPAAGTYAVMLYLARAPDSGDVKLEVDGQQFPRTLVGYAPHVMPPAPQQAGKIALKSGQRKIAFMIVGKHPQSTGYLVGIDRVRLYPAGP